MLGAMQRQWRARARSSAVAILAGMLLWLGLAGAAAIAAPRLVLVDGAELAQLHEALRVSLAPWAFEVVDWPRPRKAGPLDAAALARTANARYVVWYDGAQQELVVHDAELERSERRPLEELPRDEADASALSLSIKTMLRLQPLSAAAAAAPSGARWSLAPELALGPRLPLDGDAGAALRVQLALMVRPPRLAGLRFGLRGELGPRDEVDSGPFRGEWSEWSAQAAVGKDLQLTPRWQLGGELALGLSRATLSGEEMKETREESSSQLAGAARVAAGRVLGPLTAGVAVEVAARGASDHTRSNGQTLWDEPSLFLAVQAMLRLAL